MAVVVKNPPANTGDIRETGSIPESERCPAGGHGNPLQYSCLENPMDRGAWWTAVHGVAQSRTQLNDLACMHTVCRTPLFTFPGSQAAWWECSELL